MENNLVATSKIVINAPIEEVWEALTDPALVKEWLFGTEMAVSSWEVGGEITYSGQWEGKPYQDKGKILEIEPQKKLVSSYWSAFSGSPDSPENYQKVTYELSTVEGGTEVTITQENNKSQEDSTKAEGNWNQVLQSMKKLLEKDA